MFSAEDWQCGKCGNINWARRDNCNVCNGPKVEEVEERTGLGGGFNERENVEYKTHNDDEVTRSQIIHLRGISQSQQFV